jgi:EAL domain-containing protein (putative c-di-GMP-specific phosphodiesterase class I)
LSTTRWVTPPATPCLSYLRSFPFDKIKIDRSFINDLSSKKDSSAIVHAITGLARDLGMTTTAEKASRTKRI